MPNIFDNSKKLRAQQEFVALAKAAMPSVEELRHKHLPLIIEFAQLHAHSAPVTTAVAASASAHRTRRAVTRQRALVVAFAACLFALPGLAMAGALPAGLQNAASSAANAVGVDLPKSHEDSSDKASDNHGDDVSDVAKDKAGDPETTGSSKKDADGPRNHGDRVSETAKKNKDSKSNNGKHYGQVAAGPDKGQAGATHGGGKPANSGKPDHAGAGSGASTPKPPTPAPQNSTDEDDKPNHGNANGSDKGNGANK